MTEKKKVVQRKYRDDPEYIAVLDGLAEWAKQVTEDKGITYNSWAVKAGVDPSVLQRNIAKKSFIPSFYHMLILADAAGVSLPDLTILRQMAKQSPPKKK